MKIKAKFKGADGSVGYRNGENYDLDFKTGVDWVTAPDASTGNWEARIIVMPLSFRGGQKEVHYTGLKQFLNNWQVF